MKKIYLTERKKAQALLPEETLKIILAIIGIGLLVLLAVLLYNLFSKRNDLAQAEANINYITNIINRMSEELNKTDGSGIKTETYVLLNPNGWGVSSWPVSVGGKEKKPNACLNWRGCICFCEINWFSKVPFSDESASHLKSCNQLNVCREIRQDELLVEPNPIEISRLVKKDSAKELEITLEKQEDETTKLKIEAVSKK